LGVLGFWIYLVFKAWFIHQRIVDEDEGLDRDEDLEWWMVWDLGFRV
jgi:hypothetical protein